MSIHNKIRELGYNAWRVAVDTMDAQMTHGNLLHPSFMA
jgi:hypothetical protein